MWRISPPSLGSYIERQLAIPSARLHTEQIEPLRTPREAPMNAYHARIATRLKSPLHGGFRGLLSTPPPRPEKEKEKVKTEKRT
jgi:hypothetical protein